MMDSLSTKCNKAFKPLDKKLYATLIMSFGEGNDLRDGLRTTLARTTRDPHSNNPRWAYVLRTALHPRGVEVGKQKTLPCGACEPFLKLARRWGKRHLDLAISEAPRGTRSFWPDHIARFAASRQMIVAREQASQGDVGGTHRLARSNGHFEAHLLLAPPCNQSVLPPGLQERPAPTRDPETVDC